MQNKKIFTHGIDVAGLKFERLFIQTKSKAAMQ